MRRRWWWGENNRNVVVEGNNRNVEKPKKKGRREYEFFCGKKFQFAFIFLKYVRFAHQESVNRN